MADGNQTIADDDFGLFEDLCSCGDDDESLSSLSSSFWSSLDYFDGDVMAVFLGVVTLLGSIVAYSVQRSIERREQKELDKRALDDFDRNQALDRIREQLSLYVGPIHRLYRIQSTMVMQYVQTSEMKYEETDIGIWSRCFPNEYVEAFIEKPMSLQAKQYRGLVTRRLQPLYTRTRILHLKHSSDLADMPSQEEYLQKWGEELVKSPYLGSMNINVMFDTFTVWTYEFDDIIKCWGEGDYSRMQPTTRVAWPICNYIVDYLLENAKLKEARYNKHVKFHQNKRQRPINTFDMFQGWMDDFAANNNLS